MTRLRAALRTLLRTPVVTVVAVVSLALGIGANAAIFSLLDQLLLRSLPVEEPERLVNLEAPGPKPGSQSCGLPGDCEAVFSHPMFRDLQRAETGFSGLAGYVLPAVNLALDGETAEATAGLVSGSYFGVLGLRPALGRLLGPEDDVTEGGHPVAVLAHRYWAGRLGADPSVLNRTLRVNGQPMTIVGVAPTGFTGTTPGASPDVFVPLRMRTALFPTWTGFDDRRSYWLYVFGRLAPQVPMEEADARINSAYAGILQDVEVELQSMPADQLERFRARRVLLASGGRGQSTLFAEVETPLILLVSITAMVLLIACANIANLLLARGAARSKEMAIRGSLGGSRARLVGQLLTESFLLAGMGGLAGLAVASWTLDLLGAVIPPDTAETLVLGIDPVMVGWAALLALATGILFGLYPALDATRADLASAVREGSGRSTGGRGAARFRNLLVAGQIALSTALLMAAGLFLRSLDNVTGVDLGMDTRGVVAFELAPGRSGYQPVRSKAVFDELEERLAAVPGVRSVAGARVAVLTGSNWGTDVSVEGFESGPGIDDNARFNEIGPGYFATLGVPLLAGREFTEADRTGEPAVAIVNEAFAVKFGLDPRQTVGKRMSRRSGTDDLDMEIVGIVQDATYAEVKQTVPPLFFMPWRQSEDIGELTFYLRHEGDAAPILRAVPAAVRDVEPDVPIEDLTTLETQLDENIYLDRMIGTLSTAFAALATLLAAVGLYGVLAYSVAQRTREFGVRMALGAGGARVRSIVMRQVARLFAAGALLGLLGALAVGRAAESLLFGVAGWDPRVLVGVAVVLGAVALLAAWLPAARAGRVDPIQALRYE